MPESYNTLTLLNNFYPIITLTLSLIVGSVLFFQSKALLNANVMVINLSILFINILFLASLSGLQPLLYACTLLVSFIFKGMGCLKRQGSNIFVCTVLFLLVMLLYIVRNIDLIGVYFIIEIYSYSVMYLIIINSQRLSFTSVSRGLLRLFIWNFFSSFFLFFGIMQLYKCTGIVASFNNFMSYLSISQTNTSTIVFLYVTSILVSISVKLACGPWMLITPTIYKSLTAPLLLPYLVMFFLFFYPLMLVLLDIIASCMRQYMQISVLWSNLSHFNPLVFLLVTVVMSCTVLYSFRRPFNDLALLLACSSAIFGLYSVLLIV